MIGATNRPDLLDNALLRPGRFDIHIYCPLPDEKTRFEIFKVHTRNLPLSEDVDLEKMAEITEGYSGMLLSLKWGMNRLISRCWNCCFVSWSCHLLSLWEHSEHDYWPIPFWRGVVEHYSKNITWFVASLPEIHWKIVLLCSVHCFYIINIVCSESIRKERVIENNVDLESADPVKRSDPWWSLSVMLILRKLERLNANVGMIWNIGRERAPVSHACPSVHVAIPVPHVQLAWVCFMRQQARYHKKCSTGHVSRQKKK